MMFKFYFSLFLQSNYDTYIASCSDVQYLVLIYINTYFAIYRMLQINYQNQLKISIFHLFEKVKYLNGKIEIIIVF